MAAEWAVKIRDAADALAPQLREWREALHRHPELGLETPWTQEYVWNELVKLGCEPKKCGQAGITVLLGKKEGKVFLLRADMDALPLTEVSEESFCSQNPGKMHACGHDMHTAMLLGAAKILKENEDLLEGRVKLMFESGEETGNGASDMIAGGVLEDPKVDAAEMIHVAAGAPFPTGLLLIPQGGTGASASCCFKITATGKGGHGAMPSVCVDPITALCHIHSGIEEIFAREAELCDFLAITVGQFHAGNAPNVIPNTAEMSGSIRTMSVEKMKWAQQRIREIAEAIAAAYRAKADVEYTGFLPPLIADKDTADSAASYLAEIFGSGAMRIPSDTRGGGSEDFAFISAEVPSVPLFLAAGNANEGYKYPAHHPGVRFDETALPRGTAAHVYIAMRWLEEHK